MTSTRIALGSRRSIEYIHAVCNYRATPLPASAHSLSDIRQFNIKGWCKSLVGDGTSSYTNYRTGTSCRVFFQVQPHTNNVQSDREYIKLPPNSRNRIQSCLQPKSLEYFEAVVKFPVIPWPPIGRTFCAHLPPRNCTYVRTSYAPATSAVGRGERDPSILDCKPLRRSGAVHGYCQSL
jgi:hypothetical protein